jgi:CDP-glucose 4,6-dehydratase
MEALGGGGIKREGWEGRRVLVTGANGFVGSWIFSELTALGSEVVALVRDLHPRARPRHLSEAYSRAFGIVYGDLAEYAFVERVFQEYEIEACFHLAAQALVGSANRSPLPTFSSNIQGTWNLLEAARKSPSLEGLVVASSDKAYGEHEELPYREDFCLNALHPYDASKACADLLSRTYHHTYGLPVAVARCANIYGGGDLNFSRIVPDTIRALLDGRNPILRSDGTPVRDYLYIRDAVEAYLSLAEKIDRAQGRALNFGTHRPVTVLELVEMLIALSGRKDVKPEIQAKTKGEIQRQYLSSEEALRVLGWRSKVPLEEGLKETFGWYRSYFSE